MKLNMLTLFAYSLLLFLSCGNSDSDIATEAKKLYGKKIKFPETYTSFSVANEKGSIDEELVKQLKIVTYLDQNACTECALSILKQWELFLQDITEYNVGFIPVIYPQDQAELGNALEMLLIEFPLLYDTHDTFLKDNKIEKVHPINQTYLLDAKNKAIVVGEPIYSKALWEVYMETISSTATKDR